MVDLGGGGWVTEIRGVPPKCGVGGPGGSFQGGGDLHGRRWRVSRSMGCPISGGCGGPGGPWAAPYGDLGVTEVRGVPHK